MRILKLRGTSGGSLAAKEYNESVVPVPVEADADDFPIAWINPAAPEHAEKTVFFGEDAIHIDSPLNDTSGGEGWVVRWPFTKSGFNTTNYSSSRELLGDVQDMWLDAFRTKCGIAAKDLESFSAVLVIPDLFDEVYIREMCELLLGSMGFVQIILEQVSTSPAFNTCESLFGPLTSSVRLFGPSGSAVCYVCSRSALGVRGRSGRVSDIHIVHRRWPHRARLANDPRLWRGRRNRALPAAPADGLVPLQGLPVG